MHVFQVSRHGLNGYLFSALRGNAKVLHRLGQPVRKLLTSQRPGFTERAAATGTERRGRISRRDSNTRRKGDRIQDPALSHGAEEPGTAEASEARKPLDKDSVELSGSLQLRLRSLKRDSSTPVVAFEAPETTDGDNSAAEGQAEAGGTAAPSLADAGLEVPQPRYSRVKSAEYVGSSVSLAACPPPRYPEIAVVGRSNVGKSSLINMITGRRELALVSKTPGKTQCINHFLINRTWYLVDLPGYGYAKQAKSRRFAWGKFTQEFLKKRQNLANVLLLVDASIPTQSIDLGCAEWLWQQQVPFSLVFTKVDKRKKSCPPPEDNIGAFEGELEALIGDLPPSLVTSSVGGVGRGDLLTYLSQLRQLTEARLAASPSAA